jgi:hypothetical protein
MTRLGGDCEYSLRLLEVGPASDEVDLVGQSFEAQVDSD